VSATVPFVTKLNARMTRAEIRISDGDAGGQDDDGNVADHPDRAFCGEGLVMPFLLGLVGNAKLASDVVRDAADLVGDRCFRDALVLCHRDAPSGEFGDILRCPGMAELLGCVNAVFDPEVDIFEIEDKRLRC
jgi:hypothetical protein